MTSSSVRNGHAVRRLTSPPTDQPLTLGPVAKTMMIPLWARAAETRKRRPLVRDVRALEICERIDYDFATFRHSYGTQIGCVLRGLLYDRWVRDFLARHPGGTVVELGAGLSTRFERIDNGKARWVDVDLPDAIALRRSHFAPSPRRTLLAASVLDQDWPAAVARAAPGPYYFVSEGMLMYLHGEDVRGLLVRLADAFGPCEVALDSIAPAVVRHQRLHDSMKHMMDAPFRWGIDDIRRVERWDPRLAVRDVATLPDIAFRFRDRVAFSHRIAGALVTRALPGLARAYRLSRIAIGATGERS
jgi:O-methyltransferase involved in polyketide biosynthesis